MNHKIKLEIVIEINDEQYDIELIKETKDLYSISNLLRDVDEVDNKGVIITEL